MIRRLLQTIGTLALLAIGAGGLAALLLVKDRVRIVVTPDGSVSPDPTALLRDDLRSIRLDVEALASSFGDNLTQLHRAVEAAGQSRQAELLEQLQAALRASAALQGGLAATDTRLGAIERAVANLQATGSVATAPPIERPVERSVEPPGEPPVAAPAATPPAAPVSAPPAAATGFLTFALPSRTFVFAREQTFDVIADLSRVGFDGKSTLHDFSGVTSQVRGSLRANLADPAGAWSGTIACTAATLTTGVDGRDAAMREHLDTEHHADISFAIDGFTPAQDGIDAAGQRVRGEVRGRMTIRGVERPLQMPVQIAVDEGKRLVVEGQAALKLPDYGVPVPSQLGLVNMQEEVRIWIALRARVRAERARGSGDAR